MTNGSCHSTCESNVQPYRKPSPSARCMVSTTPRNGGSVCRTTPKSICAPVGSDQVLGQATAQELAVAGAAVVLAAVDHQLTAGQHGPHLPGDRQPLIGRVVHVHVVRARRQDLGGLRVVP